MKGFTFIYRVIDKSFRIIKEAVDGFRTFIIFSAFCTEHHNYRSFGVPYLYVSRKEGGAIILGDNLTLNNGLSNNIIGYGKTPCSLIVSSATIKVGMNVGMSQTTIVAVKSDITIGDNVKLGGGVKIYSTDFHPVSYLSRRDPEENWQKMSSAPVEIGDDCFIGAGTIILKGVTIGARTVIGAGSIVVGSIPPDCIAAGNPCRIIRYLHNK